VSGIRIPGQLLEVSGFFFHRWKKSHSVALFYLITWKFPFEFEVKKLKFCFREKVLPGEKEKI
jgi:hypothetical protein